MKCPYCSRQNDRVVDSRTSADGVSIRRRRECQSCQRRYTSYERLEEAPILVIKKDQRREPFSRDKVLAGLLRACEKRPVPLARLEAVVDLVERKIQEKFEREVESGAIGEIVVEELRQIDKVAYVRFASVYQAYDDVSQFVTALEPLVEPGDSMKKMVRDVRGAALQE